MKPTGAVYAHLADELQSRYDLTRWAVDLPRDLGVALRATFANVQDALWDHVQEALATLESEDEWRGWLQAHDGPIDARADDFWVWQGHDPGWGLLSLARDLLTAVHGLRRELDRWTRPADACRDYARGWYCIDQDYRRLREALDASPRSHDRLRDRCARSYRDVLRRMNDRFCHLLEAEGSWSPQGERPLPQDGFWAGLVDELRPGQRVAVMYVDALWASKRVAKWGWRSSWR
jgi:hypothetical protein